MRCDSYVKDIIYNVFQKDYKVKFNYKLDTSAIVKPDYSEINWWIKGISLFEISQFFKFIQYVYRIIYEYIILY